MAFKLPPALLLRGCHTQGKTYEEALKNIQEAIALNLDYLTDTSLVLQ